MHNRRLIRWIAVGALVFAGLAAAVDVVALQVTESRAASQLVQGMAAERATVDLGSFPFLPNLLRGRLELADVSVTGASGGGLRVANVRARVSDPRFSGSDVISLLRNRYSTRTEVRGDDPVGVAQITQDDLETHVMANVASVHSLVITSGQIVVYFSDDEGERLDEPARFVPDVRDRRIALRILGRASIPPAYRDDAERLQDLIDLPLLPEGLRTNVTVGNGVFAIEVSGPDVVLRLGEGSVEE